VKAKVNPKLLVWARDDAGLTLAEAAQKLRIQVDLFEAWEEGIERPTISQMRRVADLYKRPLALFYLSEIPSGFMVIRDFRRLPGEKLRQYPPELRVAMRRAHECRRIALELAEEVDTRFKPFGMRCSLADAPDEVAARIRKVLSVTLAEQTQWREPNRAFRIWRERCENADVLVFQASSFSPAAARGFSIADDVLPVIVVNRKDAHSGRIFTLLHELTHILLREGGVCDLRPNARRITDEERVEVFCNAVAGSALVPTEYLASHPVVVEHTPQRLEWDDREIEALSATFAGSREVVVRRLFALRRTSMNFYERKREEYEKDLDQIRLSKAKSKKQMKRNIPGETVGALGRPFISLALETYHQQRITLNDLSDMLGVKSRHIEKIEKRLAIPFE
jgi:Zn-dependent peptidase ImmA (M78 family)/transcriptional regulator with XRE-family HTH domain